MKFKVTILLSFAYDAESDHLMEGELNTFFTEILKVDDLVLSWNESSKLRIEYYDLHSQSVKEVQKDLNLINYQWPRDAVLFSDDDIKIKKIDV
jgi:hypothetical protein